MKAKTFALVVLAAAVALAPHLVFATLWYASSDAPDRAAPRFAGGVQPAPMFDLADPFQVGPRGQACTSADLKALRGPVVPLDDCTVTGPFTHANLSVYLIHGRDTLQGQQVMPLQSALEQNLVVVHEGALAIDNFAAVPVFIQAGDIVKGGSQDRVLPSDHLVAIGRHHLPLTVFCVEAGRSGPRGHEVSTSFQSATEQLPGKRLNLAARHRHSQLEVWNGVRDVQQALARNVGGSVQSPQSQTSLQLTLENGLVQRSIQKYLDELATVPNREQDVIGVAVAVNNQIQSADIYASSGLFRELWPKLMKANAVAALTERQGGAPGAPPTAAAVHKFLTRTEKGEDCQHDLADGTRVLRQEAAQSLLFDTCDPARQNLVLHRSFLAK
jgi:hypothetical protein